MSGCGGSCDCFDQFVILGIFINLISFKHSPFQNLVTYIDCSNRPLNDSLYMAIHFTYPLGVFQIINAAAPTDMLSPPSNAMTPTKPQGPKVAHITAISCLDQHSA